MPIAPDESERLKTAYLAACDEIDRLRQMLKRFANGDPVVENYSDEYGSTFYCSWCAASDVLDEPVADRTVIDNNHRDDCYWLQAKNYFEGTA